MKTSDFDYVLPPELIAQTPIEPRDQARLMVVDRSNSSLCHHSFSKVLDYLRAGDVMVFNNTRVIAARLSGQISDSLANVEILLLRRLSSSVWETLVKPGKRFKIGTKIQMNRNTTSMNKQDLPVTAEVIGAEEAGLRHIRFSDETRLPELGKVPLPPYIHAPLLNPERYQTVYANVPGSTAAPTAGLHFTPKLIEMIKGQGIHCLFVTLHIGLDTFQPVREDDPLQHRIHREFGIITPEVSGELSLARAEGRRIIAVGTTTVRLLETAAWASSQNEIIPFSDWVSLYILPGHQFRAVDALITNFHLPRSTLIMLVSAFAGCDLIKKAYQEAITEKYRFYSFGDAMFID